MLSNADKARYLRAWAMAREQAGAPMVEWLGIQVDASWAEDGTLLDTHTTPVHWPTELEHRRRLLGIVDNMTATIPAEKLHQWRGELVKSIDEAEKHTERESNMNEVTHE
jgi:hypothetical protein